MNEKIYKLALEQEEFKKRLDDFYNEELKPLIEKCKTIEELEALWGYLCRSCCRDGKYLPIPSALKTHTVFAFDALMRQGNPT